MIALTDQKRLQALSAAEDYYGPGVSEERLAPPWDDFRTEVERSVSAINVSHRVRRKVAGVLHEDTIYGPTKTPGEFVVRKPVESLTPAMIDDIRDPVIRQIVVDQAGEIRHPPRAWREGQDFRRGLEGAADDALGRPN